MGTRRRLGGGDRRPAGHVRAAGDGRPAAAGRRRTAGRGGGHLVPPGGPPGRRTGRPWGPAPPGRPPAPRTRGRRPGSPAVTGTAATAAPPGRPTSPASPPGGCPTRPVATSGATGRAAVDRARDIGRRPRLGPAAGRGPAGRRRRSPPTPAVPTGPPVPGAGHRSQAAAASVSPSQATASGRPASATTASGRTSPRATAARSCRSGPSQAVPRRAPTTGPTAP